MSILAFFSWSNHRVGDRLRALLPSVLTTITSISRLPPLRVEAEIGELVLKTISVQSGLDAKVRKNTYIHGIRSISSMLLDQSK